MLFYSRIKNWICVECIALFISRVCSVWCIMEATLSFAADLKMLRFGDVCTFNEHVPNPAIELRLLAEIRRMKLLDYLFEDLTPVVEWSHDKVSARWRIDEDQLIERMPVMLTSVATLRDPYAYVMLFGDAQVVFDNVRFGVEYDASYADMTHNPSTTGGRARRHSSGV